MYEGGGAGLQERAHLETGGGGHGHRRGEQAQEERLELEHALPHDRVQRGRAPHALAALPLLAAVGAREHTPDGLRVAQPDAQSSV